MRWQNIRGENYWSTLSMVVGWKGDLVHSEAVHWSSKQLEPVYVCQRWGLDTKLLWQAKDQADLGNTDTIHWTFSLLRFLHSDQDSTEFPWDCVLDALCRDLFLSSWGAVNNINHWAQGNRRNSGQREGETFIDQKLCHQCRQSVQRRKDFGQECVQMGDNQP